MVLVVGREMEMAKTVKEMVVLVAREMVMAVEREVAVMRAWIW